MAALDNSSTSEIDKTSYWWTGLCAICHVGGGPSEFDRDGDLYYNADTGEMGWEARGETAAAQDHDGDYSVVSNQTGAETAPAPWDKTGVYEADCLYCHRVTRHVDLATGKNFDWIFRAATLRGVEGLQTADGLTDIPAFASAPTASQGWADVVPNATAKPPKADSFDFNYGKGVTDGSLLEQTDGTLKVNPAEIQRSAKDLACWGCHVIADDKKRGRVWFDPDEDVHYAGFNSVSSSDSQAVLDAAAMASTACAKCHPNTGTTQSPLAPVPNDGEHNFAKGNANLGTARDDTDFYGFKSCGDCHLATSPDKDPAAPTPTNGIHNMGAGDGLTHIDKMSCQFCHIPLKHDNASLSIDNATYGSTRDYSTDKFLSSNPLDPTLGDTSAWYPSATVREDSDGQDKIFPAKLLLSTWIGDWDDKTSNGPSDDDRVSAVALWRVRGAIASAALTANDDDNDTINEVNTAAEIENYLTTLAVTNDTYGVPIAAKPVLVKGEDVFYMNGAVLTSWKVADYHDMKVEGEHPFSIDHNVLAITGGDTLGAVNSSGCTDCHTTMGAGDVFAAGWVFDRQVLVNPFNTDAEMGDDGMGANPVYKALRDLLPPGWAP